MLFEEDIEKLKNVLTCAFRVDNLESQDIEQIAKFKGIVNSYLKMNQLLRGMRINKKTIEQKANIFRLKVGLNTTEAIDVKTIVRKNNILTVYLPMSEKACGLSLLSPENDRFILVTAILLRKTAFYYSSRTLPSVL